MSDYPWEDFAPPPAPVVEAPKAETKYPWEDFGGTSHPAQPPSQSFGGMVGQVAQDVFMKPAKAAEDLATNPVTMAKALPYVMSAAATEIPGGNTGGMVAGRQISNEALRLLGHSEDIPSGGEQLAEAGGAVIADAAGPIMRFFKPPPSLIEAGVTARTIKNMVPPGANPAKYGEALEKELRGVGALSDDAKKTWDAMNGMKEKAGQAVGDSLQKIATTATKLGGENPLALDAEATLKPILDGWAERAGGSLQGTRRLAKPFEEAYQNLMQTASQQGGKITMDNIHSLMDEVGPLVHKGPEATQQAYSELYGALADTRDQMVQSVAKQANDPKLAQNLLNANAAYSKFMRLMPDVTNAAAKHALKEGVSAFQKMGGPHILRYAAGISGFEGIKKLYESLLGSE